MSSKNKERLPMISEPKFDPDNWENRIRGYMDRAIWLTNSFFINGSNDIRGIEMRYELEPALMKRRTAAILNTRDIIVQRYGRCLPTWLGFITQSNGYSSLEESYHLLFAASIWILDHVTESGDNSLSYQELFELLPKDERVLEELPQINAWDSHYSKNLILSVEYVLRNRNRDIAPLETDGCGNYRVLTSILAAQKQDHANVPSRQTFDKLIALIPQEKIEHAVQSFMECFWVWIDNYFRVQQQLEAETEVLRLKVNEIRTRINQQRDKIEKMITQSKQEQRKHKSSNALSKKPVGISGMPLAVLNNHQGQPSSLLSSFTNQDLLHDDTSNLLKQAFDHIHKLDNREAELYKEYQRHLEMKAVFAVHYNLFDPALEGETCEQVAEILLESMVPLPEFDCFELCFAFLYLIEQDSDFVWLYGACYGFMSEVAKSLPWANSDYIETDDEYWSKQSKPHPQKPFDFPNWYENKYSIKGKEADGKKNIAQIIYETTGCIMPRDMHRYDRMAKKLGRYGFRGSNVTALLYCMLSLGYSRRQMEALNFDEWYMQSSENESEAEKTELSKEELLEKVAALEKDNRQLRSALHSTEKTLTETTQNLTLLKEKTASEHRELADLREMLFRQSPDEPSEEKIESDLFPYEVQEDIIVFGGHDTWLKAFRQLLSGKIKYVGKEQNFDVTMIRYCESVWIQPNAISHAQYYKIVDAARKYKKPIRYFQFASAAKCAEQIVKDMEE